VATGISEETDKRGNCEDWRGDIGEMLGNLKFLTLILDILQLLLVCQAIICFMIHMSSKHAR
jgi:hypothetical protein